MPLRAKCPECGFVATVPAGEATAKRYCPRCDARLPRPTRSNPVGLVLGLVGAAVLLFCLLPAGAVAAWLGWRERPAAPPAAGPVVQAEPAPMRPAAPVGLPPAPVAPAPSGLPADGSLPPDVLEKLKAATAFVKVRTAEGLSSGSGFVLRKEGDDAFLVTNHHVVADRAAGPGRKTVARCEVVFHSGRRTEFTLPAVVLASDDSRDLAVLRVSGVGGRPGFPDALGAAPGEPHETLPVFILGFPFGGMLATATDNPAVTIGKGTVSSVREDESGETSIVQIDGDINPGNSGGPVVDARGRLIGITVAKIKGTNIGLAIPTDHLAKMLQGRLSALGVEERPAGEAGKIDLQVRLTFIDPFNKVRSASVIVAPAEAVGPLPARGPAGYPAVAGRRYPMAVTGQAASVSIPMTGTGLKRFVIQPVYANGEGDEIFAQPVTREVWFERRPRPAPPRAPSPTPGSTTAPRPPTAPGSPPRAPEVARPAEPYKPSGKDRPIGEVRTKEVVFGTMRAPRPGRPATGPPPCLCWSANAKAFFALDAGANVVRRYSFPDLTEQAKLEVGKECTWLSPCKEGLLLTLPEEQEAWVLDEATLKKRRGFAVPKSLQVVSARESDYAYSVSGDAGGATLSVHEVKTGRPVTQQPIAGVAEQVGTLVLSPDGKRLYTIGGWTSLVAHDVDGATVKQAEKSHYMIGGRFNAICLSADGQFVCAPTGGGNGGAGRFPAAPYTVLVFRGSNVSDPVMQLKPGSGALAMGFDLNSGLIYTQNWGDQLILLNDAGLRLKAVSLEKPTGPGREVNQFLVHPDGRKLVAQVLSKGGVKAIAVELPVPK